MEQKYPHLCSPITLGRVNFRNHMFSAPMGGTDITAALAQRAGFQMVMVHAGHGWLVNQFLSPNFNHRADEYGGSFENRPRFAREVLQSVRNAVGQRSNRDAVMALRTCAPWAREIGDCGRVSNITNAVYQGYHAALDI